MNEIHYLLGNSCNLECNFCFWDRRTRDVPWKVKKHILDEIKATGITKVTLSGGEPTLNKDFTKVLRYLKKMNVKTVVHTNGLVSNDSQLRGMAKLADRVSLSLDGSNSKVFAKMRRSKNIYRRVLLFLDKLSKLHAEISVKTLVTKANVSDLVNIGKLLETKKIKYWSLLEFNPINRGARYKKYFQLSSNKFDEATKETRKAVKGLTIKVRLFKRKPERYCFITSDAAVYTFIPNKGDVLVGSLKDSGLKDLISRI